MDNLTKLCQTTSEANQNLMHLYLNLSFGIYAGAEMKMPPNRPPPQRYPVCICPKSCFHKNLILICIDKGPIQNENIFYSISFQSATATTIWSTKPTAATTTNTGTIGFFLQNELYAVL